ncbi:type VII secretion protein EccB [Micromonospora sp. NPDC047548]|uniref:type VII secretion protein EccB n=1 Tax=Micromonospora sp. NPDC047548 TaxID=3155624 RepID=UPI0033CA2D8E
MQTQRDHVHAHQFQMGRMSSALVLGDPSSDELPARRALVGLLAGVLIAVLALVGFGVYGWLVPGGNTDWRASGTIVVEKQTGNRYLYLEGRLRPVPNLTSAMLLAGSGSTIRLVSAQSLAGVPRGSMIGLVDAPQSPPATGNIVAGPWLACLSGVGPVPPSADSTTTTGGTPPPPGSVPAPGPAEQSPPDQHAPGARGAATLPIGINFDPNAAATPLDADRFVLVTDHTSRYLVRSGTKHPVGDGTVIAALGLTSEQPVTAPADWLSALPDGPDIAPARLPGAGTPGPAVAGAPHLIGQLYRQDGVGSGDDQLFVLTRQGLTPVDATEFLLLQAATGRQPVSLTATQVATAARSDDRSLLGRVPDLVHARLEPLSGRAVCLRQSSDRQEVTTTLVLADRQTAAVDVQGGRYLRPDSGLVVYGLPVPQRTATRSVPIYLISDAGVAYRLPDSDSVQALKLGKVRPVGLPGWLVARLPAGPELSREAIAARTAGTPRG